MAGYPHASVPMGQIHGVPVSLSFIGTAHSDAKTLSFAYAYEQLTHHRVAPSFLESAEERIEIERAMRSFPTRPVDQ